MHSLPKTQRNGKKRVGEGRENGQPSQKSAHDRATLAQKYAQLLASYQVIIHKLSYVNRFEFVTPWASPLHDIVVTNVTKRVHDSA